MFPTSTEGELNRFANGQDIGIREKESRVISRFFSLNNSIDIDVIH